MESSQLNPRRNTVAIVRWSRKPGDNPVTRFIALSIFGLILCLFLMIFLPFVRNWGCVALFTIIVPALLTAHAASGRRDYMRGLVKRVNDTVAEVTNTPGDQLSVTEFQHLVKTGEQRPLLVSGVPGLSLQVHRMATAQKDAPWKWLAVLTVVPPENGTESFDRLVAAAIDAGPIAS